jgi:post-segregation antitoxin (ccd killing protein)
VRVKTLCADHPEYLLERGSAVAHRDCDGNDFAHRGETFGGKIRTTVAVPWVLQPFPCGRCVYAMRMARVNVYLPDDLAQQARAAGLNISGVTQEALRSALARGETDRWLQRLEALPQLGVPHERVMAALDDARSEFGAPASD